MLSHYSITIAVANKVIENVPSPFISTNGKTIASVDFGICSFMKKGKNSLYSSKVCEGCYAVNLLNVYPDLRKKIEGLPLPTEAGQLEKFEESLKILKTYIEPLKRLRFYALADFAPSHIPYIKLASKYFEVDIISKALSFPQNEEYLKVLLKTPNVYLSLSFNKNFMKFFDRICGLVKNSNRAHLNYTLNYNEENPDTLPFRHLISVWHIKNDRKRYMIEQGEFETLKETNVCGMFDGDGNRNTYVKENRGNGERVHEKKGSCHACQLCRQTLKGRLRGEVGKLPEKLLTA